MVTIANECFSEDVKNRRNNYKAHANNKLLHPMFISPPSPRPVKHPGNRLFFLFSFFFFIFKKSWQSSGDGTFRKRCFIDLIHLLFFEKRLSCVLKRKSVMHNLTGQTNIIGVEFGGRHSEI